MQTLRVNVVFSKEYEFDLEGEDGGTKEYWLAWLDEQVISNGFKLINEDGFEVTVSSEEYTKDVG